MAICSDGDFEKLKDESLEVIDEFEKAFTEVLNKNYPQFTVRELEYLAYRAIGGVSSYIALDKAFKKKWRK